MTEFDIIPGNIFAIILRVERDIDSSQDLSPSSARYYGAVSAIRYLAINGFKDLTSCVMNDSIIYTLMRTTVESNESCSTRHVNAELMRIQQQVGPATFSWSLR